MNFPKLKCFAVIFVLGLGEKVICDKVFFSHDPHGIELTKPEIVAAKNSDIDSNIEVGSSSKLKPDDS